MTKKKYSTIIFDFDGTIADSLHLIIDIFNSMAHKFNAHPVDKQELEHLRSLTPKQLIHELKIPLLMVPELLFVGRRIMKNRLNELKPIGGIETLLKKLSKEYTLGVLTSNNTEIVESFFVQHRIHHFAWIHSEKNLFGKDKAIRKRLKMESLKKAEVLYVGDEIRDIEGCAKVGIDIASVSWGFNAHDLLKTKNPTYLIDSPAELAKILLNQS